MKTRPYQLSKLEYGGLTIAGYSVAGEETVIVVPELDCAFDIGKCPREALTVNNVLISHSHMDHIAGLPYYFAQRDFQGIENGTAVVPEKLVGPLEELMSAWGSVEGHVPPYKFKGLKPGDEYQIRRDLVARTFPTRHTPGSLGFSIIEVRKKLRSEFAGLSSDELVALKKKGEEITYTLELPLVAYLGDTSKSNYSDIPYVCGAKVLLIECTFFDSDHISRARAGKHLHVNDLPEVLEGMQNEKIVLVHLTRRTNMGAARKILRKKLSKDILDRITFLMSRKHMEED